jgi:hypothetical protein
MRDVTKTKPSHHRPQAPTAKNAAPVVTGPTTPEGTMLAAEVNAAVTAPTKLRLIQEIIEYEGSHGKCTQTFTRKVRKQLRA